MDFIAIDFETANEERSSACALGIAVVRKGRIVERKQWLIRPPQDYFNSFNVSIHGITPEMVAGEPNFGELWPSIKPYLENEMVVAHHAGFDMGVLKQVLFEYSLNHPRLNYSCSRVISKKTWPDQINYSLKVVAAFLGIEFVHHDAEEDARACAQIVIAACEEAGIYSVDDLAEKLDFVNGQMYPGGHRSLRYSFAKVPDIVPTTDKFDPAHPLFAKTVVFTGKLNSMTRRAAMQRVANAGGNCSNAINGMVDFLVVGNLDFGRSRDDHKSQKIEKAEKLVNQGIDLEVISEYEFLELF